MLFAVVGELATAVRLPVGQPVWSVLQMVGVCDQIWGRVHDGGQSVQ